MAKSPDMVIVDFRETITKFASYSSLYEIYKRFPMQEVIRVLLSIPAFTDYSEILFIETEQRFADVLDTIGSDEMEIFQFFYDSLAEALDEELRRKLTDDFDYSEFVFVKWVDQTTLILRRD